MKLPLIPGSIGASLKLSQVDGVLGGKIWPAAAALCQYLSVNYGGGSETRTPISIRHCVELGSGTGVVGLYAAATLGCPVTLTEHQPPLVSVMTSVPYSVDGSLELEDEEIMGTKSNRLLQLLQDNIDQNLALFKHTPYVQELDWNNNEHTKQLVDFSLQRYGGIDLILASDVTYNSQLHESLATTISYLLDANSESINDKDDYDGRQRSIPTSKCIISHEERILDLKAEDSQLSSFQQAITKAGLKTISSQPFPIPNSDKVEGKQHKVCILEIQLDDNNASDCGDNNSNDDCEDPSKLLWTPK